MKITATPDVSLGKDQKEINAFIEAFLKQVAEIVNSKIEFGENIPVTFARVNFGLANIDARVAHSLGRVPTGYIITKRSSAITVYDGAGAWDENAIYLRSSAQGIANLFIF